MTSSLKFDNSQRKIWNGTAFVTPATTLTTLQRMIEALSDYDRTQLYQAAIRRDPYDLSESATEVYNAANGRLAKVVFHIQQLAKGKVSVQNTTSAYSVKSETVRWGTRTTFEDESQKTTYMWGERTKDGKPDETVATARLLGCAFKPLETGTTLRQIQTPSRHAKLYPKNVTLVSSTYAGFVEKCTTIVGVQQTLEEISTPTSPMKPQVTSDLTAMCPEYIKGFGAMRASGGIICAKGVPTAIKAPPANLNVKENEKALSFEVKVEIANQMASSIGSSKNGIGLIRSYHYDGISDMVGAARERHEWLTDFIYQDAQCYFVRTRDSNFALALQRCIKTSNRKPFIVVYEAASSSQKLGEHVRYGDDNAVILKTGIIGIPSINWTRVARFLDTYYISFKPPTRAQGTGGAHITNSIRERQAEHTVASGFQKYMYYGFLAAMGPKDKVTASTRGRDTRVIFSNNSILTRSQAAYVVLNMARHATVYPYIHSCYMYQVNGSNFYPGVRDMKDRYDFSRVKKTEYSLGDLGDDVMGLEVSFDADPKGPAKDKPDDGEQEEEEEKPAIPVAEGWDD